MTASEKLRALIDNINKAKAEAPRTGGDGRMQAEAVNTSAVARNMAMDRFKVGGSVGKTLPLKQLMQQ